MLLAPGYDEQALELLREKKNVRLLELRDWPRAVHGLEGKPVIGGMLVQDRDVVTETREQMSVLSSARAERGASGRTCCSPGGVQARALERDRDRRAAAPRSASAPAR